MSPFDYINSINAKKDVMVDDLAESQYVPFIVNRGLSYFPDTIMSTNRMNMLNHLDNKLQYHYLINTTRPRKRFSKWAKKHENSDLEVVKEYYGYNNRNAEYALSLLTKQQLEYIKNKNKKGGIL